MAGANQLPHDCRKGIVGRGLAPADILFPYERSIVAFSGPFFSAPAHGLTVGGWGLLGDLLVFTAEVALGREAALSGDLRNGAIVSAQVLPGGSDPGLWPL